MEHELVKQNSGVLRIFSLGIPALVYCGIAHNITTAFQMLIVLKSRIKIILLTCSQLKNYPLIKSLTCEGKTCDSGLMRTLRDTAGSFLLFVLSFLQG